MEFIGIDKYISQFSILSFHEITLSLSLSLSLSLNSLCRKVFIIQDDYLPEERVLSSR